MKLGTIKRISRDDLSKSGDELPKWIDTLLEPLNQFIEKTGLALQGNLTLDDNFLCKRVSLKFTHNVAQSINPLPVGAKNLRVTGVIPVSAGSEGIDSFKWIQTSDGTIDVTFKFVGGTSATVATCALFILLG